MSSRHRLRDDGHSDRASPPSADQLWAKTPSGRDRTFFAEELDERLWLNLGQHSRDSADVGQVLADTWLPRSVRERLSRLLSRDRPTELPTRLLGWLAGTHDLGKAELLFQSQIAGNPSAAYLWEHVRSLPAAADLKPDPIYRRPHSVYSELILRRWLTQRFPDANYSAVASLAAIAGCHHGRPSGLSWLQSIHSDHQRESAEFWLDSHSEEWAQIWWTLIDEITERTGASGQLRSVLAAGGIDVADQLYLAGFVSMCDWIASNQMLFPLTTTGSHRSDESRAQDALRALNLTQPWQPPGSEPIDFRARFGWPSDAQLRPSQTAAARIAQQADGPALLIIEDETGRGKTEAAQLAAEVIAARTGAGGLAFALPSMTTTDAMLPRLLSWIERLNDAAGSHSLRLIHSRAALNPEFEQLLRATRSVNADDVDHVENSFRHESVTAHAWFGGRKGVLSEFVVCTVDQILMMALATRYVTMRHLGLAGKVIIIDEVHSYDVYTSDYLAQALTWLATHGCSVILLSATLASGPQQQLALAYADGLADLKRPGDYAAPTVKPYGSERTSRRRAVPRRGPGATAAAVEEPSAQQAVPNVAFPRITTVTRAGMAAEHVPAPDERRDVHLSLIDDDPAALIAAVVDLVTDGGVIGIVCNTVSRAQHAFACLSEAFPGSVDLLHSQFTAADRARKEAAVSRSLGVRSSAADGTRPRLRIVVGTQVIEQSLDIDFDALISDLAPTDSLAQRAGRLHRHQRERPTTLAKARLLLRGADLSGDLPVFDPGSIKVYGERVLLATVAVLRQHIDAAPWCVRHELASAVEQTYAPAPPIPESWTSAYMKAARLEQQQQQASRRRAKGFQLSTPRQAQGQLPRALQQMLVTDADRSEAAAQASVRDIEPALEACLVQRLGDRLYPLQWLLDERDRGIAVSDIAVPPYRLARAIADSAVRLPRWLVRPDQLDAAIAELESLGFQAWQQDYRLRGELILPLDENLHGTLLDRPFAYDPEIGLVAPADTTRPTTKGGSDDDNR